jgi:GNAT superfamily N-acetyltransferase
MPPLICSYREAGIDHARLVALLLEFGDLMQPPLQQQFDIEQYAEKLLRKAEILVSLGPEGVSGLLAIYANDTSRRRAHIPLVAVQPSQQGLGLGRRLLEHAVALAVARGMHRVDLEVRADNHRARRLYSDFGFHSVAASGAKETMTFVLDATAAPQALSASK